MGAAERWARGLAAWEIPEDILRAAPEPPWGFSAPAVVRAAERALEGGSGGEPPIHGDRRGHTDSGGPPERTGPPAQPLALEALPPGGSVLDVGAGAGAASLPLAPPAGLLVAVDESADMLDAFARGAGARGVAHREVVGRWPDVAHQVEPADVVVCHHVLYNVAEIVPFARALTDHAHRRVVVELTERHPMVPLNPLWKAIHGIDRPSGPQASDAIAALEEMGLRVNHFVAQQPPAWAEADRAEQVAFFRRRLCVGPDRDREIDELLGSGLEQPRRVVAVWWDTNGT